MTRFVQPVPALDDPYATDTLLRSWLERQLGAAGHAAAKGRLADLAADVVGSLRAAHADAEAHPPTLVRYDPWGARVDRIDTSAGWQTQRAAAARHAVVALPYLDSARGTWGAAARVVQHALLHLYGRSRPPSPARSRWPTVRRRCSASPTSTGTSATPGCHG